MLLQMEKIKLEYLNMIIMKNELKQTVILIIFQLITKLLIMDMIFLLINILQ